MDITVVTIDDENIDDIFSCPTDYVDDSYDRPLFEIWSEGKTLFTILIGMDSKGAIYLVAEDDEVSEDFYPSEGETLWDVYEQLLDDWIPEET